MNRFLYAVGVAAFAYLMFRLLGYGLLALVSVLRSFANWYQFSALPNAEVMAVIAGVAYLLINAVIHSKNG